MFLFFFVMQVTIRNANVYDSRFNKGLYIKYKPFKETEFTTTKTVKDTLSPEFDEKDAKVFHFEVVKQDLLEWFDSGCIIFQLMGRQEDSDPDATRTRMTTKVRTSIFLSLCPFQSSPILRIFSGGEGVEGYRVHGGWIRMLESVKRLKMRK